MNRPKWYLLLLPLLAACVDKVDFNNLDDLEYNGEWALPLVQANLSLNDVVNLDSTITVDPDGAIRIIYENDSVYGASIADFVKIPDQAPQAVPAVAGVPKNVVNLNLGTLATGEELDSIFVNSGHIDFHIDLDTNIPAPIQIEVALLNAFMANGDTAKFIVNGLGSVKDTSYDISGLRFDLTDNGMGKNILKFSSHMILDGGMSIGTSVDVLAQMKDVEVGEAYGFFGNRQLAIAGMTLNPGISGFENLLSGLRIENPTIQLKLTGNVGLPFSFQPNLDGVNKYGSVLPLSVPPVVYNAPASMGDWDTTYLTINNGNSNIVDFISSIPNKIVFAGDVEINPNGNTGVSNFIQKDGEMTIGLKVDVPVEIKTNDLVLENWINSFSLGIDEEDSDIIENLKLHFKVTNGLPFDADLNAVFYKSTDSNGVFQSVAIDSVQMDLLNSAVVDASGRVTQSTVSRTVAEFNRENIKNLMEADRLRLVVTLNSYNGGQDVVKLFAEDFITIALGIQTKLNYSLN